MTAPSLGAFVPPNEISAERMINFVELTPE